jgi:predicted PurR-regulated permease PerM
MINRLLSFLAGLPGALWRNTVGRVMGSASPAEPIRQRPIIQPAEPRSVAGIAFRASLVVLGVGFAAYLIYELRLLLILIFLAVLLAAGMYGVVRTFERILPRILAVLVSYLLLIGGFALAIFLIFPPLIRQAVDLVDDLPRIADDLRAGAIDLIDGIAGAGSGEELIDTLTAGTGDGLPEFGSLLSVPLTAASILANLVIVIFLSALISLERDRTRGYLMNFIEEPDREAVL